MRLEVYGGLPARVVPGEELLEERPPHVAAQPVELVGSVPGDQAGPRYRFKLPPLRLLGAVEQRVVDYHVAERVDAQEIAPGCRAGERDVCRLGRGEDTGNVHGHLGPEGR